MTEDTEKVATAIIENITVGPDGSIGGIDKASRAAILALREPSGDLLDCIHGRSTLHDWRAMLAAAVGGEY